MDYQTKLFKELHELENLEKKDPAELGSHRAFFLLSLIFLRMFCYGLANLANAVREQSR